MGLAKKKKPQVRNGFPEKKKASDQDKILIEQLKEKINQKLKDPAIARKMAQIIEEVLEKK